MIGVDIDSTLYDFATPMRQAFFDLALEEDDKDNLFRGGYQYWAEWRSPADVCGIESFEKALSRVHSPEVILAQQPYEYAKDVVRKLAEQHDILYISNRDEGAFSPTWGWLNNWGFPRGELVCTMEGKQPYLAECQYLIDDRPRTLVEFVYDFDWCYDVSIEIQREGRKAFGLLFEYNRALTDIPNIYLAPTWRGLEYYLTEKGVLDGTTDHRSLVS